MTLIPRILAPSELTAAQCDEMYALMDRFYENMDQDRFRRDLSEKDWVILLIDSQQNRVSGFSTQTMLRLEVDHRPVNCVFSGDTIVDPRHWGTSSLPLAFGQLACRWIEQYPDSELYWYLISKGFRTYRVLPVFFREFFPRYDAPTPPNLQRILAVASHLKFAGRFDPHTGIIYAAESGDRLRPGPGEITAERLQDPHVRFFAEKNPGHIRGDELCCIARLAADNFSPAAQRLVQSEAFHRFPHRGVPR